MSRAALLAAAALLLALTGCGTGSSAAAQDSGAASAVSRAGSTGGPFGPGCPSLPTAGPGSLAGLGGVPAATAAAAVPGLSQLSRALGAANLNASLDSQSNVTVFAPVDAAFQALPADRLKALLGDVPRLTAVLTHHVVQGRLAPDRLTGSHTTLDNDELVVRSEGERLVIAGSQTLTGKPATVVCGNLQTTNATVYLVDQVLKPQAAG